MACRVRITSAASHLWVRGAAALRSTMGAAGLEPACRNQCVGSGRIEMDGWPGLRFAATAANVGHATE